MKTRIVVLFSFISSIAFSNGVGVIDATTGSYLKLLSSTVSVVVEDQVSLVTTMQIFKNTKTSDQKVKYAFPTGEGASATGLRWNVGNVWYVAKFTASPQDTSLPGSGGTVIAALKAYLGKTPLYFDIPQKVKPDSLLVVELQYVELLPYKNGNVDFVYPNDYRLIQSSSVDSQKISFTINSQRTIDSISVLTQTGATIVNSGHIATVNWKKSEAIADANYQIRYTLKSTELGLFSFASTNIPDSLGYFAFVVEPNPNQGTDVLKKVFTLIIDRSGSMSGTKMDQAKNAAAFIVNNLNEGDKFNLIDFDDVITSFRPFHALFTSGSRDSALVYIQALSARNTTDIAGAFSQAIPQFASSSDSTTANIIIFLTDGLPTAGITSTEGILSKIQTLVSQLERKINIFVFGIGADVNTQLLALIASQNNGLAEFLGPDELQGRISDFYLKVRNPVIINTEVDFSSALVTESYPSPLPNLYKGQQLLVAGLYKNTPPVTVTFSGTAFGKPVSYQYLLPLSDTAIERYQFLPKLWAKKKIEYLMVKYYSLPPTSLQADSLKKQITTLSVAYGVLSPFTSLSSGGGTSVNEKITRRTGTDLPSAYVLLGNFPNPFNPDTRIQFQVNERLHRLVFIRIYNTLGQIVRELRVMVDGSGQYEVMWNGKTNDGAGVPSGAYVYVIDFGNALLAGKMLLVK